MLREDVAQHYRAKGYNIRERTKIRGESGAVHSVDMVAMGSLGNLVIAFEDAGGFEGPEMAAVRRAARDVGATPVMAARKIPEGIRRAASNAGVVLIDEDSLRLESVDAPVSSATVEYEPWPDTAKPERDERAWPSTKSTDPGLWKYPRGGDAPRSSFDWLQPKAEMAPLEEAFDELEEASFEEPARARPDRPRPVVRQAEEHVVPVEQTAPVRAVIPLDWRLAGLVLLFGATTGGVFYGLSRIFG